MIGGDLARRGVDALNAGIDRKMAARLAARSSISSNPTVADIDITTNGTDWLWAGTLLIATLAHPRC